MNRQQASSTDFYGIHFLVLNKNHFVLYHSMLYGTYAKQMGNGPTKYFENQVYSKAK